MHSTIMELELVRKVPVADGVIQFDLQHPGRIELPRWEPGAHIALALPGGERQYSLCGNLHDPTTYTIAVLRQVDGRGGSLHLCDEVQPGDSISVREPLNHFGLTPGLRYLFIAGGIGITPVLAMAREARRAGSVFQIAYGGRSLSSMAYVNEVLELAPDAVIWPEDKEGRLNLRELMAAHPNSPVYCCGPEGLLTAVEGECAAIGREAPNLERFSAVTGSDDDASRAFTLVLARSGESLVVPAHRSALDVLTDAGADVFGSCLEGTCGTCQIGVLGGIPEHRDVVLTPEMRACNDRMMPCVSRARTDSLVVDL